jgi:hypothetical protein
MPDKGMKAAMGGHRGGKGAAGKNGISNKGNDGSFKEALEAAAQIAMRKIKGGKRIGTTRGRRGNFLHSRRRELQCD